MNSPIKYFGGKGTMFKHIIKEFPPIDSYDTYIEPFGGSFSIGLKKEETEIEIYNDMEENVYSLYKVLSDKNMFKEFKKRCDLSYYSEQLRSEFRENLKKDDLSRIDRAYYFFYVNRTSHNGVGGLSLNMVIRRKMSKSTSDFLSSIDRLPELHHRLSKVIVLNRDGTSLINKYNRNDVFIYCDPPYEQSTRTSARYKVDMDNNDHKEFIQSVIDSKSKILISGYDCDLYDELLENGFTKIQFDVNTVDGKGRPKTKTETLWKNYEGGV